MNKMKENRFAKLLENKRFLQIISIVFAVIGWLVVAIVINPDASATVSDIPVHVEIEGSGAQDLGLSVVSGEGQLIRVNVRGKRYEVGSLKPSDFQATAYPTGVTAPGEYQLKIKVEKVSHTSDFEIISYSVEQIPVTFDRISSKSFNVLAEAPNIIIADEFIAGDSFASASPNQLIITGPEQNVNLISKCVVRTEAAGEISSTSTSAGHLVLYGADGQEMDPDQYQLTLSTKDFMVTVPVMKKKTVPITFGFLNAPSGIDETILPRQMSETSIEVAASAEIIDNLVELNVGYVDFRKLSENYTETFDVELPSGFKNLSGLKTVTVAFDTSNFVTRDEWIAKENLKLINVPDEYEVVVATDAIKSVQVMGTEKNLDGLSHIDIVGEIDLLNSGILSPGQYSLPVVVKFPSRNAVWAVGDYSAVVHVKVIVS